MSAIEVFVVPKHTHVFVRHADFVMVLFDKSTVNDKNYGR